MTIKALISRNFKKEYQHDAHFHNAEIRALATVQPGYISGTTMVNLENPNEMLIVSTWENKAAWDAWYKSEIRKDYYKKLRLLLESEEEIAYFSVAATAGS